MNRRLRHDRSRRVADAIGIFAAWTVLMLTFAVLPPLTIATLERLTGLSPAVCLILAAGGWPLVMVAIASVRSPGPRSGGDDDTEA